MKYKKKFKSLIYLCICKVFRPRLCRSKFNSNCNLCTPGFGKLLAFFIQHHLKIQQMEGGICELASSDLCSDVLWGLSLGFGWATQGDLSWGQSSIVLTVCFRSLWCCCRDTAEQICFKDICIWMYSYLYLKRQAACTREPHTHVYLSKSCQ